MQKLTLNIFILIIFFASALYSQMWKDHISFNKVTNGIVHIASDSNNHIVYYTYGHAFYIDKEALDIVADSTSVHIKGKKYLFDNNRISQICTYSNHSYMRTHEDTLSYITSDTVIQFTGEQLRFDSSGIRWIIYNNNKYYIMKDLIPKWDGMYIFDEETLELTLIHKDRFGRTHFPSRGAYSHLRGLWNDEVYYFSIFNKLISYDTKSDKVDSLDLKPIINKYDKLKQIDNARFVDSSCYLIQEFGLNASLMYIKYNLNTLEYEVEDIAESEIFKMDFPTVSEKDTLNLMLYADHKGSLFAYVSVGIERSNWHFYMKKSGENWQNIALPKKHDISGYLHLDVDNTLWGYARIKPEYLENPDYKYACVRFNPYADTTSIADTELFTIYPVKTVPNPARTTSEIKFYLDPRTADKVNFKIYNYSGMLINELNNSYHLNKNTGMASKIINVESLSPGVYYLVVDNDVEKRAIGFVVE